MAKAMINAIMAPPTDSGAEGYRSHIRKCEIKQPIAETFAERLSEEAAASTWRFPEALWDASSVLGVPEFRLVNLRYLLISAFSVRPYRRDEHPSSVLVLAGTSGAQWCQDRHRPSARPLSRRGLVALQLCCPHD